MHSKLFCQREKVSEAQLDQMEWVREQNCLWHFLNINTECRFCVLGQGIL